MVKENDELFLNNQTSKINSAELYQLITNISKRHITSEESKIISKLIVRGEKMGVKTHGLHYFVHSIYPHLLKGYVAHEISESIGSINSSGQGGIGFLNTYSCIKKASQKAKKQGHCIFTAKNPGKVGALRVYCPEIINEGQLIIIAKNTAPTQGISGHKKPLIGTNPICIGIPDSDFILDISTSTVATNSIRLKAKMNQEFTSKIGWDHNSNETSNPKDILEEGAFLSTFAEGPFWYKSFYLGLAIEFIGAMAGGKTSYRVGKHKGTRLYSEEGLLCIIVDKSTFPYYNDYLSELDQFVKELKAYKVKIPGSYDSSDHLVEVAESDLLFIKNL